MGAQWKHAGRTANALKRGAMVSKMIKEIMVAAKTGDPNPEHNARLRVAVEAARKASVPRDNIDRALKRAAGLLEPVNFETVLYEGFAPHNVAVIVECLTDNKNRTASDVRVLFRKGQLGSIGSVGWMFDHQGVVEGTHADKTLDLETVAIEAGAQNVEPIAASEDTGGQAGGRFICDPKDLDSTSKFLSANGWSVTLSEMSYIAKNLTELADEPRKEVVDFLNDLDDNDDVHRVYAALK
jgi:YebC/PmpR family DNA-binding regulatory protein